MPGSARGVNREDTADERNTRACPVDKMPLFPDICLLDGEILSRKQGGPEPASVSAEYVAFVVQREESIRGSHRRGEGGDDGGARGVRMHARDGRSRPP